MQHGLARGKRPALAALGGILGRHQPHLAGVGWQTWEGGGITHCDLQGSGPGAAHAARRPTHAWLECRALRTPQLASRLASSCGKRSPGRAPPTGRVTKSSTAACSHLRLISCRAIRRLLLQRAGRWHADASSSPGRHDQLGQCSFAVRVWLPQHCQGSSKDVTVLQACYHFLWAVRHSHVALEGTQR